MVRIIWFTLGPIGERNVALVDPIKGREIVLYGAQPDGQLDVAKLD